MPDSSKTNVHLWYSNLSIETDDETRGTEAVGAVGGAGVEGFSGNFPLLSLIKAL